MSKKYWFRARRYGMGWVPATREGWLITLLYIIAAYVVAIKNTSALESGEVGGFISTLGALTLLFIAIAYRTGEPLRWRWGKED